MSNTNTNTNPSVKSAYQKLAQIVTDIKEEKISASEAIQQIQLREGGAKENSHGRPYAKVTKNGAIALYGIAKEPIIMYESQWNRLQKTVESGYLKKYMEYNKERISHRKPGRNAVEATTSTSEVVSEVVGEDAVVVEKVEE